MQEYDSVKLVYPNNFRKYIYKISEIEIPFNWFLCSNRYIDDKSNYEMCEISKFARFYCEKTGMILAISRITHLIILTNKSQIKNAKDGFAIYLGNLTSPYDQVCHDVIFFIKKGILKEIDFQMNKILLYSKQKNHQLKDEIDEFPDCYDIDNHSLKKCNNMTRKLYKLIKDYLYPHPG